MKSTKKVLTPKEEVLRVYPSAEGRFCAANPGKFNAVIIRSSAESVGSFGNLLVEVPCPVSPNEMTAEELDRFGEQVWRKAAMELQRRKP